MKSIKEKAKENCIKYGNLGNVAYQEFEAGTNYVLEEVERLLNSQKFVDSPSKELFELIEQLKK